MSQVTDIRIRAAELYLLPVQTRVPLKFGNETLTEVTCARVRVRVEDRQGRSAEGWGETPLSVQWVWPAEQPYQDRFKTLVGFTERLVKHWSNFAAEGHALEIGHAFIEEKLAKVAQEHTAIDEFHTGPIPWLAALVCNSPFDIALHDAYGQLAGMPTYATYTPQFLSRDLSTYLEPAADAKVDFHGRYPADYLVKQPPQKLAAWHLVGGLDWLDAEDRTDLSPADGHPVFLADWIRRDGLKCLKIKLRGNNAPWDYQRILRVGEIAQEQGVSWLSVDYNCTVKDPAYVTEMLDKLRVDYPRLYSMIRYVEQPFPYELEKHRIDVHSVSARKPLFLDESAHDWRVVKLGRELGWNGVALKTCKTQTGALLSLCWAKAHGMQLMVQDLTNPMLAQIPHVLLAAHAGTIMGVETNAMQFYPAASEVEARIHPGLYQRVKGMVDLSTVTGPGFGYRVAEIARELPPAVASAGAW